LLENPPVTPPFEGKEGETSDDTEPRDTPSEDTEPRDIPPGGSSPAPDPRPDPRPGELDPDPNTDPKPDDPTIPPGTPDNPPDTPDPEPGDLEPGDPELGTPEPDDDTLPKEPDPNIDPKPNNPPSDPKPNDPPPSEPKPDDPPPSEPDNPPSDPEPEPGTPEPGIPEPEEPPPGDNPPVFDPETEPTDPGPGSDPESGPTLEDRPELDEPKHNADNSAPSLLDASTDEGQGLVPEGEYSEREDVPSHAPANRSIPAPTTDLHDPEVPLAAFALSDIPLIASPGQTTFALADLFFMGIGLGFSTLLMISFLFKRLLADMATSAAHNAAAHNAAAHRFASHSPMSLIASRGFILRAAMMGVGLVQLALCIGTQDFSQPPVIFDMASVPTVALFGTQILLFTFISLVGRTGLSSLLGFRLTGRFGSRAWASRAFIRGATSPSDPAASPSDPAAILSDPAAKPSDPSARPSANRPAGASTKRARVRQRYDS
jgi:hypothetical protein